MKRQFYPFSTFLSNISEDPAKELELFALLNLGIVQSVASGVLTVTEATQLFYNADNCLYVQRNFLDRNAKAVMSHGVQLSDLFDCLPAEEARREFYHELEKIRLLCLELLYKERSPDVAGRVAA